MNRFQINVRLESPGFDGPLELLLTLINKNEIDIYDIPISELTEQYLEYINSMDDMSEFILMAAMLLEIKSKMLLPQLKEKADEESDPRDELVRRLEEYKLFKDMAEIFKQKGAGASQLFFRAADTELIKQFTDTHSCDVGEILDGLTHQRLFEIFTDIINRRELRTDKVRSGFDSVEKDSFTLDSKITAITKLLKSGDRVPFKQVFDKCNSKIEKIVTFLAVLELIRRMKIKVEQENTFDDIFITSHSDI